MQKSLNFFLFFQKKFYYLQNISYPQIATFLSKCLIFGKKVRFQPIVPQTLQTEFSKNLSQFRIRDDLPNSLKLSLVYTVE